MYIYIYIHTCKHKIVFMNDKIKKWLHGTDIKVLKVNKSVARKSYLVFFKTAVMFIKHILTDLDYEKWCFEEVKGLADHLEPCLAHDSRT